MPESIRVFENSLRDYLISVLADSHNTQNQVSYKFNNLKVYMDPKRKSTPHFYVSAGISEACFNIENLEIDSGNLGSNERFVLRWAGRANINGELRKQWAIIAKSGSLVGQSSNSELEEKLKVAETETIKLVGSGSRRKFKAFETKRRKNNYGQKSERIS